MAINLIQPQGDLMAPALMAMAAVLIVVIPAITLAIRLTLKMLKARI